MIVTFGSKMTIRHIISTIILGLVVIQLIRFIGEIAPAVGRLLNIGQVGVAAVFAIAFAVILARRSTPKTQ
jgi:site-specific recombinase